MGISLYGLTPATTYDALIKTGDNGPITSALKVLSDGLGTNLPMEASTTGVNFTGVAQVGGVGIANTTQVAAKQDTLVSGTNIKTINGTSVLGAGNIVTPSTPPSGVAGAIQFSAGSAFNSDATNFFWDNTNKRLGLGTNTPTTTLQIDYSSSTLNGILVNQTGGTNNFSNIGFANGGTIKATLGFNLNTGEVRWSAFPGGYFPTIYSNGSEALRIDTSGNTGIGINAPTARLHIKGSGSTSATTSLLVQNSAGTEVMRMRDDGVTKFLGGAARIEATYIWMNSGQLDVPVIYNAGTMYLTPTGNVFGSASRIGSALLQVDSTTQGFLPPRMTTTQKNAIATPAAGLVVYDNTTNKLQCYNGSTWNDLF